ncbi:MAG: lasso peptide isopeptide bond-forming cyclase [Nostocaceae cyanobacterium]|nr:lasso peptide isopeptide bond-forming cyclase [Nostocaceae cyanobacterium]
MSGIFGIYHRDGRFIKRENLIQMSNTLEHRGTDGSGLWCDGSVGLGDRLLWSTPESILEQQPLVEQSGDYVITADTRLDNREELFSLLNLQETSSTTLWDSQLILAAYKKWGQHCPQYLLGDFAFAIWDRRKQQLFCARDHFGVKPFYYFRSARTFAWATEIKAILCLPEVSPRLNEVKVADYLISFFEDKAITFYQDILRLPPAHSLIVNPTEIRLNKYWFLDPNSELRLKSDRDYAEAFREHFSTAVNCRLRSAFPIGSLLSGGLDSSSITCMARQLLTPRGKTPLKTFSAIFDTVTQCDERKFIQAVVAQGGIEPHYVPADQMSPLSDFEQVFWHQDEAFYAPNLFMHSGLYRAACQQGVRVLLDGFDGDTTVSHGVTYMTELARQGKWLALTREVRGFAHNYNRDPKKMLWKYVWPYGLAPIVPSIGQRLGRKLTRKFQEQKPPTLKLNPVLVQRLDLQERIQQLQPYRNSPAQTAKEAHYRRLNWGVIPFSLEVVDRAAAPWGIEPRYPFFDKRLVEFCLSLPPQQKISRGWTRMVMRRGMNEILPPEVQWRGGKSDLSPNFHHGLRTFERERFDNLIQEEIDLLEPYIDIVLLRETYQRFAAGETMSDSDVMSIWKPLTLLIWLKHTGLVP